MSSPHHSGETPNPDTQALFRRFIEEGMGTADRHWPQGRISGDDDGETTFAIAADPQTKIIRIQFTKPMMWLGLDADSARKLAALLLEKAIEISECRTGRD